MNQIVIIGQGARENALHAKIASTNKEKQYRLFLSIVDALREGEGTEGDLYIIGPEDPLAAGVTDMLLTHYKKTVFGPSQLLARLESSKGYSNEVFRHLGIPTPQATACFSAEHAIKMVESYTLARERCVLKPDGLTGGKGVCVPQNPGEAERYIQDYFQNPTAQPLLVVRREYGRELSLQALCDGTENYVLLPPSSDYKPVNEGDTGGMTGGMGCVASRELISDEHLALLGQRFIAPLLQYARTCDPRGFRGCLYVGLMFTNSGPKALEVNVRFGDPEAQTILPLLTDEINFLGVLQACATGTLREAVGEECIGKVLPYHGHAVTITVANANYPHKTKYTPGDPILSVPTVRGERVRSYAYASGVSLGRLSSIVSCSETSIEDARVNAYKALTQLPESLRGKIHWRTDIGADVPHFTLDR